MGDKSFFKPIGSAGDKRLRFRIGTKKGKVVEILVQLEVLVEGVWKPVVRYDNAHDFAHRDILDLKGREAEKTPLKLGSLGEVLEYAEQDSIDRLGWYVERFLGGRHS